MAMDETTDSPTLRGWSAVYALVRDSRLDLLKEVAAVSENVDGLKGKIDTHLLAHQLHDAALATKVEVEAERTRSNLVKAETNTRHRETVRTIVQTIVPIIAIVLALLK